MGAQPNDDAEGVFSSRPLSLTGHGGCAAMKLFDLNAMTRGWFIGDFEPTALSTTACEAAVKRYGAGDREAAHFHSIATEITLVVEGTARFSDEDVGPGCIVVVEPGEVASFEAVTDVTTVVVKVPSAPTDKHPAEPAVPASQDR